MSSQVEMEADDNMLAAVGRIWWLLLFGGLISLLVGIIVVFNREGSVQLLAILFAIYLIISGLFEIVRSFASGLTGGTRALLLITGVLSVILGVFAIRYSGENAVDLLGIFVGIAFLFRGFASLFTGFDSKEGRGWNIFFGIIMLVGGDVIMGQPAASLEAIAWIVGIWLVLIGIYEIIASFVVRSRTKDLVA
ncbi:MAG: HdeD family acid-resistance protein [Actinomycetales bacterium]|nr:HdeD family acid-resistance protein [Actinomycetales bacterium]